VASAMDRKPYLFISVLLWWALLHTSLDRVQAEWPQQRRAV